MADFFGKLSKTTLGEARRLVERYTPERYKEIMDALSPQNGATVSYKHLTTLLRIEDDKKADTMLTNVLDAGLSTRETAEMVNKALRKAAGSDAPRRKAKPKTFWGVAENTTAINREWNRTYEEDWGGGEHLVRTFAALTKEQLDNDVIKQLDEMHEISRRAAEAHGFLMSEFARMKKRTQAAIINKKRQGGKQHTAKTVPAEVEEVEDSSDTD
jgi:hypothetical protein